MNDRCINVDGALVRVSKDFDESEGSDDMKALKTLLSFLPSREERAKRLSTSDCRNRRCDYNEPHKHGFACGPKCACGLGMQASPVVGGESE